MKKYTINLLLILFVSFALVNCGGDETEKQLSDFTVMLLSDVHISNDETKDERLSGLIDSINAGSFEDLEALLFTGDNVSSFYRDRYEGDSLTNNRAVKFIKILEDIEIPYYIALGNHDYKIDSDKDSDEPFTFEEIDTMEVLWEKFGDLEPYYSVEINGWKMIMLNSMRGRYLNRAFDDEQIKFLKEELEENKPALLFFHHPIKTDNERIWCKPKDLITPEKEMEFFKIVKENKEQIKGIFVGHGHMWVEDMLYDTIPVYETDSFADNEKSPYRLIKFDTAANKIHVTQSEFELNP